MGISIRPTYQGLGQRLTQTLLQALPRSFPADLHARPESCLPLLCNTRRAVTGKDSTEIEGAILEISIYGWCDLHGL